MPSILTAQDIADYLRISRKRVYELMQIPEEHGGIPCFNIGKSRRVELVDFERWVKRQKKQST